MKQHSSIKKFYFLEYFYVVLKSIHKYPTYDMAFGAFRELKEEYRLGESKYRKISPSEENLTRRQLDKFKYTFAQVIDESAQYKFLKFHDSKMKITDSGLELIDLFENNLIKQYNDQIFFHMERVYQGFRYLVSALYSGEKDRLLLPIYSPLSVGLERSALKTTGDMTNYSNVLVTQLEKDLKTYNGDTRTLKKPNSILLERLVTSGLLSNNENDEFEPLRYNAIIKRFRDYWLGYFLKGVYGINLSMSSFEIWSYRAKQIGILHATEFYPRFHGRLVYPLSILAEGTVSDDFSEIYSYSDKQKLFRHEPVINDTNIDLFIEHLQHGYYRIRRTSRGYFVNLSTLREIVCYRMKISERIFDKYLNDTYKTILREGSKISISLEVDKLPEETKANYLKREPILIDGKFRNIIAIDIIRG